MYKPNPNNNIWYIVRLWDVATPSFCSADKKYLGTKQDMQSLAQKYKQLAQRYEGENYDTEKLFAESIERYFSGSETEQNSMVYGNYQLFEKAHLVGMDEHHVIYKEYTHKNIYGFDYRMRFAQCITEQYIVKQEDDNNYEVYSKFSFINLEMYNELSEQWRRVNGNSICNQEVLEYDETDKNSVITYTLLGLYDNTFHTVEDADEYISCIDNINYKTFFDEVFGDM